MLHTTKRCITQRPLSHQEFDANWQKVEEELNKKDTGIAFLVTDARTTQIMDAAGTTLSIHITVRMQNPSNYIPIIKCWGILNNKIIAADFLDWEVQNINMPLSPEQNLNITITGHVGIHRSTPWPWPLTVYVEDEKGNYAEPYTFTPTFD